MNSSTSPLQIRLTRVVRAAAQQIGPSEIAMLAGVTCLAVGFAKLHPAASWIVVGGVFLYLALRRR